MTLKLFDPYRKKLHPTEVDLISKMVAAIEDESLRSQIVEVLPKYRWVIRDSFCKELRLGCRFILGKAFRLHKEIPELTETVELSRVKLKFENGSSATLELLGVSGHLYGFDSRDARVANLYKNPFEIVWIKSVYDPTKLNPKVVAARKKYLPNLDLERFGWERRSKTTLELIEIDEKEYIMLWEKEEEILLGHRGKVYRYNMIDDDNLGVVTAEELKVS